MGAVVDSCNLNDDDDDRGDKDVHGEHGARVMVV